MKNVFICFLIALAAVSCGQKGAVTKTKFKIFSGNIIDPTATFPGGLLVMGRSLDDAQSFIISYTPGMELELKKGPWEFATIGWMGAAPLEGNQQCAYQRADISTDIFDLSFNMSYLGCLNNVTLQGELFSAPYLYNAIGGTPNGFKKLNVTTCVALAGCTTFTDPISFKVEVLPHITGIATATKAVGLLSNCINGGISNITPPYGGIRGFIGTRIVYFSGSNCSGTPKEYFFDHGFGEKLDRTFIDINGVTQIRRGALSLNPNATDSTLALAPINYLGKTTTVPGLPAANSLYHYIGATVSTPVPASAGDYIYYNGTSWISLADSASVKLMLEAY